MRTHIARVALTDDVAALIEAQTYAGAYLLLNAAADCETKEQRPMTLEEALRTIHEVARQIEALG